MKKVIIIGASGFIGSHLLNELVQLGFQIIAIENKRSLPQISNIEIVKGGINSVTTKLVNKVNPDIIFHCARPTMPRVRRLGRSISAKVAAYYNRKLIRSLKKSKSRPVLIFASGSLVYGTGEKPFYEDAPLNPISFAKQYHIGEKPLLGEALHTGYPVMMLRFPWLLGNGSWFKWFYLDQIRKHNAIPLFGDGNNKMHILDIHDAVKLIIRYAFDKNEPGIFNIFGNAPLTQYQFTNTVAKIFNAEIKSYSFIFSKTEKEALEAFNSNIELSTLYPDIIKSLNFIPLYNTLRQIKNDLLPD